MPKRTRFFESLEERRLLTGWTAPTADVPAAMSQAAMTPAALSHEGAERAIDSEIIGPSSSQSSSPTSSQSSGENQAASPATPVGDADSAETANEYLSANGAGDMTGGPLSSSAASGASFAALDLAYVNPEASGTAPYYSGSSYAPTKTYTTTSTDPVPISPATLAAMAQPMQLLQGNNLASEIQAMASSSPAAADLSNIARSGIGGLETGPDDVIAPTGVAQMPADLPPPGTTTPVAIVPAAMTSAFELLGGSPTAALISEPGGALSGGVLDASFAQSRWLAGLVSGTANADLPSIEQAVGRLCERMERWGEELFRDAGEWRLSESLVLAAAAAAAFEYVRAQGRESGSGPFAEDNREPWQPRLRKPFGRPADSKRRFLSRHRDQA